MSVGVGEIANIKEKKNQNNSPCWQRTQISMLEMVIKEYFPSGKQKIKEKFYKYS